MTRDRLTYGTHFFRLKSTKKTQPNTINASKTQRRGIVLSPEMSNFNLPKLSLPDSQGCDFTEVESIFYAHSIPF